MVVRCVAVLTAAVLATSAAPQAASDPDARKQVEAVLDALHDAASKADGERYFALFVPDAVFLGTDPAERWPLEEFRTYAMKRFATGTGWTYDVRSRSVAIGPQGDTAWFDEVLDNAKYGECRGSGALVRHERHWRIAQYNLTIPVPNDLALDLVHMIREHSTAATSAPAASSADVLQVDPVHSSLLYRLRHFGVSHFHGRVNLPSGEFRLDERDPAGSFINVSAEIKNMDSGNEGRDRFITSPDFFNAREYPTADFKSTSLRRLGGNAWEATGDFTMHGVTKPVIARLDGYTARQTEKFGFRAGFEATFTVKRSDFGMDLFVKEGTLGDDVRITASIEGVRP